MSLTRPKVDIAERRSMTPARKRRIWEAELGQCGDCGTHLPVDGPLVAYDHIIALALGGPDNDDNVQLLCRVPCHAKKTTHDLLLIAKAKRLAGETCASPTKRPLQGRGFNSSLTRGFDGKVRPRQQKAHADV